MQVYYIRYFAFSSSLAFISIMSDGWQLHIIHILFNVSSVMFFPALMF